MHPRREPTETPEASPSTQGLVEHFFRHQYGRLVATLTRRFGAGRLAEIEDAVSAALEQALGSWTKRGLPEQPEAWLFRVAQNKLLDRVRREAFLARSDLASVLPSETPAADGTLAEEIADDELRLLFACADEGLPPRSCLVLCLKLLCGFGTREIAHRLFLTEANTQKTLERGREHLRVRFAEAEGVWANPSGAEIRARLSSVLKVIYLQFNEGYSSLDEDAPQREDLCREALRLGHLLAEHPAGDTAETWALLALMHLHAARLRSRLDSDGRLLLLEHQDRSRWDDGQIELGLECLGRSATGDTFSRYHGEAAILAEHCLSPSYEATRWGEIVELYELLEKLDQNPLHTLNRAIALAEWKGASVGLRVLQEHQPPTWLASYYLWDAAVGELLRRSGQHEAAVRTLERALERTPTRAERAVFEARLDLARKRDAGPLPRPA